MSMQIDQPSSKESTCFDNSHGVGDTTERLEPASDANKDISQVLRYDSPAEAWTSALPVGNGRLGAMIYGRTKTELIQLNEDAVWYGGLQERAALNAGSRLAELRRLIRQQKHPDAERLMERYFFSRPTSKRHYEPLATMKLHFEHSENIQNYTRTLDLERGTARMAYHADGILWRRSVFASYPQDAIVMHISASKEFSFRIELTRRGEIEWDTNEFYDSLQVNHNNLVLECTPGGKGSNHALCRVTVLHGRDGSIEQLGNCLGVNGRSIVLIIEAYTAFRKPKVLRDVPSNDYDTSVPEWLNKLELAHWRDYQQLLGRTRFTLHAGGVSSEQICLTSDLLIDTRNPKLFELYHNFGRYLLTQCSRTYQSEPGLSLPANLQGIWNPSFSPAWGCGFTININLQMNYWPCHAWNLSRLSDPMFYFLKRLAARGKQTAREMYGCYRDGAWCAHSATDIWADTNPADAWAPATLWPLGGAWLALHIYERYEYEGENDDLNGAPFLPDLFPILQGAAAFALDLLVKAENEPFLVPSPSMSPENSFYVPSHDTEKRQGNLCEGSTIDLSIISTLFKHYLAASEELQSKFHSSIFSINEAQVLEVSEALRLLSPLRIGPDGRLLEWREAYDEPEPGHRHFSHLFALYPGKGISVSSSPELAEACRESLRVRLEHGGAHTGWSRAWLVCLYARLLDGEECLRHLQLLLSKSTLPNLFDSHPPMQIDGNFGGSAGILEMLIQSHETETTMLNGEGQGNGLSEQTRVMRVIRLLPACPSAWLNTGGSLHEIRARGGFLLSFEWGGGHVAGKVVVHSDGREQARIVIPGRGDTVLGARGKGLWTLQTNGTDKATASFEPSQAEP